LNARKAAAATQSTSQQFTETPAPPQSPAEATPPQHESDPALSEKVEQLEQKVMDLTIMNAGKDLLIGELRKERVDFINRIENSGRLIGRLKTQLLRLTSGRQTDGNVIGSPAPDTSTSLPVSNVSPNASLSDIDDDLYEQPQELFAAEQ
jgi:hypothetical protein